MDNSHRWERDIAYQVVPYEEGLVRLYALRDRYDAPTAASVAGSASERHKRQTGHRLAYGCCRDIAREVAELEAEDAALADALERERYAGD